MSTYYVTATTLKPQSPTEHDVEIDDMIIGDVRITRFVIVLNQNQNSHMKTFIEYQSFILALDATTPFTQSTTEHGVENDDMII